MPRGTLISLFIVAALVNYIWELAQAPLYVGLKSYSAEVFWHCFIASLGDGVMVLLIYLAGWILLRRSDWFERPGVSGYVVMLSTGFLLSLLVEWAGLHLLGRWRYTDRMPLLPVLGISIVPIAQMLVIPPLIFRLVAETLVKR
jgi:hypothetical protein